MQNAKASVSVGGFMDYAQNAAHYSLSELLHSPLVKPAVLALPVTCTSDTMSMVLGCIFNSEFKLILKIMILKEQLQAYVKIWNQKSTLSPEALANGLLDELCNQLLGSMRIFAQDEGVHLDLAFIGTAHHFREVFQEHESDSCSYRVRAFQVEQCTFVFQFGFFEFSRFDRSKINQLKNVDFNKKRDVEYWDEEK